MNAKERATSIILLRLAFLRLRLEQSDTAKQSAHSETAMKTDLTSSTVKDRRVDGLRLTGRG